MEYLEGETPADRIARGPLPLEEALRFAIQTAEALDAAHRCGIVHRDLKPGKVMLTRSGVKLLDFGLARPWPLETAGRDEAASDRDPAARNDFTDRPTEVGPITRDGTILGTIQYMAPEQLEGRPADARTDIFALGAVLYEMTTGRRAFEGKRQTFLIAAILKEQPPAISIGRPASSRVLERIVGTCLAKDPEQRWQSAREGVPAPIDAPAGQGHPAAPIQQGSSQDAGNRSRSTRP